MLELHVWGSRKGSVSPSFDAECVAAVWLLEATLGRENYVVVQSSNPALSPREVLPLLRDTADDKTSTQLLAQGLDDIVRWLRASGHEIDASLPPNLEADRTAVWYYTSTHVRALTAWLQFVNNDNYYDVTRPLVSSLVAFPLQYNVASRLRKRAQDVCYEAGISGRPAEDDNDDALTDRRNKMTALSRLHDELDARKLREEQLLESAKETMRITTFARRVYSALLANGRLDDRYLFENVPSSADLLLLAHIRVHLSDAFPSNPLRDLIASDFPLLKSYADDWSRLEKSLQPRVREPRWQDKNDLVAAAARAVGYS